jgi:diguanylate cyclase (GGDEF)-like protein
MTPELGADGEIVSVLAVGRDITEIDEYRQSIHHMAFYDALTDLPNRALLTDRIRQTIADASWHGHQFGVMLLDLDRFKEVNDTLGHGVGDLLLRQVAERLLQCVRIYDTVARLGGDEFAILLPQVRESDDLATIARKIIEIFEPMFNVQGKELFISTSIGIALYPGDSTEIDSLFRYADSAMYHAKKLGRNNFQFYSRELTIRSTERMVLESALRKARVNHELELYYQPQVDLATGRIVGAEALLRWNHPEVGLVMPDKFIPVAEEAGLIVNIGEWVLLTACQAAATWNCGRAKPFKVAVNLSTRQFIQNNLLDSVRGILIETHCEPEWIKLEITESLLLEDILDILKSFDAMGLAISIADFGTGYSALSYLNRFPVSQIKIDRSFVRDIPGNQEKAELVKAMISIAHALNLELVAEGVETQEQAEYLNDHGCLLAQGYLYSKPIPFTQFENLISTVQE